MSCPAALIAAAAGGFRSSARAQPKMVIGSERSANNRITRQKPTREPYWNIPSAARSRPTTPGFEPRYSVRPDSDAGSPSPIDGSDPSSKFSTKLTARRAAPGQVGVGGGGAGAGGVRDTRGGLGGARGG